jgi:hypothetical protein
MSTISGFGCRIITGHGEPWTTFRRLGLHENAAADGAWTRIHFRDELGWLLTYPLMSRGEYSGDD